MDNNNILLNIMLHRIAKHTTSRNVLSRVAKENNYLQRADIDPGYLIRVTLSDVDDPPIQRVLRVPKTISLHQLHAILQIAFGWASTHMYEFRLYDDEDSEWPKEQLVEDHIEANAMSMDPRDVSKSSKTRKLSQIWGGSRLWREQPAKIIYEYDMGDGWEHEIEFLGSSDWFEDGLDAGRPGQEVVCLEGEGHPAAEDCGGPYGWEGYKVSDYTLFAGIAALTLI